MSDNKMATKEDLKEMYNRIYPYLGGMPEVLANKFSKGDMYSTDEKMIGQWIDGKPLYQKVITGLNVTPSYNVWINVTDVSSYNIDYLLSVTPLVTPTTGFSLVIENLGIEFRFNEGKIDAEYSQNVLKRAINMLIIQYTKTTDSAISIGNDTDYSTDEKVVGTWLNGEPLYQKTIQATIPTTQGTPTDVSIGASVDTVVDAKTMFAGGSGEFIQTPVINGALSGSVRLSVYNNSSTITSLQNKIRLEQLSGTAVMGGASCYITIQYTKTTD